MKTTVFVTPGEFDLESIKTFGMNAKPNSDNPIGYFGTGLKFAIAVLLRHGAEVNLYCNGDHYSFYTKSVNFRGSIFDKVCYRRENGLLRLFSNEELDYTTELGRDWELWMAFRELYSNTLDEGGEVTTLSIEDARQYFERTEESMTYIVVEHVEFAKLVETKDKIFLNPHRELIVDKSEGNVTKGRSKHLYYRGMRAMDLPEDQEALFTWNIIEQQELTEDRTLKSSYSALREVRDIVTSSEDKEFIKAVLTAPEKTFEHSLDFEYVYGATDAFKEVLTSLRDHKSLNASAGRFYGTYIAPPAVKVCSDEIWRKILEALEDVRTELEDRDILDDDIHQMYLEAFQEVFKR